MLDEETTLQYIRKAKSGDNSAKEVLIENNTSLLKCILKRYLNKGVEYDDLFQLAAIGFLKAISGFDEKFGVKFSTYAVPMIAGEIKRFLRDDGSIKVSRIIKRDAKEINAYISDYILKNGEEPSTKIISERFNIEESEVVFIMGSSKMPLSLYEKGDYKDEESREILEKIPSDDNQDDLIETLQLKNAIEELGERERKIIVMRYFRDMTQSEVAKMIGVSQVQVSRIESRILENFKVKLG